MNRRKWKSLIWFTAFVGLLWAGLASATVMKFADLTRLVEISDVVVHGTVLGSKTYRTEPSGQVVTDTTIRVARTFAGDTRGTVTFQQWGGDLDGVMAAIPGDATFEKGEEVVVFLHRGDSAGHLAPANPQLFLSALGQSKYTVVRDGGKVHVRRALDEIAFLEDEGEGRTKIVPRPPERFEWVSFVAELESLVAGIKGGEVKK